MNDATDAKKWRFAQAEKLLSLFQQANGRPGRIAEELNDRLGSPEGKAATAYDQTPDGKIIPYLVKRRWIRLAPSHSGLLNQIVPQVKSVAYLSGGPTFLRFENEASGVAEAASVLGWEVIVAEAKNAYELDEAFAKIGRSQSGSLIVGVVPHFTYNSGKIIALAQQSKIPTIYPFRIYVDRGGLMSYAADYSNAIRKVSIDYVARILKGAKVADLPIQQPDKFELIFNRKAAKELNLEIPPTLLALADEVIE
jgi:putative tryptophan/tyrosine transport system substrate-binding protein